MEADVWRKISGIFKCLYKLWRALGANATAQLRFFIESNQWMRTEICAAFAPVSFQNAPSGSASNARQRIIAHWLTVIFSFGAKLPDDVLLRIPVSA